MSPSWDGMGNLYSDGRRGRRGVLGADTFCYGVARNNASSVGIRSLTSLTSLPSVGTLLVACRFTEMSGGFNEVLDLGFSDAATTGLRLETVSDRTFAARWYNASGVLTLLKDTRAVPLDTPLVAAVVWDGSSTRLSTHLSGASPGSEVGGAGPVAASGPVTMWARGSTGVLGWAVLSEKLTATQLNSVASDAWGPYAAAISLGSLWGGLRISGEDGAVLTDTASYGVAGNDPLLLEVEGLGAMPSDWVTEVGATVAELTITGPWSS